MEYLFNLASGSAPKHSRIGPFLCVGNGTTQPAAFISLSFLFGTMSFAPFISLRYSSNIFLVFFCGRLSLPVFPFCALVVEKFKVHFPVPEQVLLACVLKERFQTLHWRSAHVLCISRYQSDCLCVSVYPLCRLLHLLMHSSVAQLFCTPPMSYTSRYSW